MKAEYILPDSTISPKRAFPLLLIILFLVLILLGINLGEVSTVMEKAIKICLDCIGIG
ncbi:MAG: CD1871A family CXXC motif-containing protein [Desulfobacterales bacterium]|nr:CD1871A family CXXC motif-containing protein [Desulfobacterales bacterium]